VASLAVKQASKQASKQIRVLSSTPHMLSGAAANHVSGDPKALPVQSEAGAPPQAVPLAVELLGSALAALGAHAAGQIAAKGGCINLLKAQQLAGRAAGCAAIANGASTVLMLALLVTLSVLLRMRFPRRFFLLLYLTLTGLVCRTAAASSGMRENVSIAAKWPGADC
jgi:hypothetical protein